MPNPDTITVVLESKYFGRLIKLSIFYISLFPPQSKLKLYSHNCNFLFQNVSAKFTIDFSPHSIAASHNCNFVSRNCNFISTKLQSYSDFASCNCNFIFQNVTEYFANATLFFPKLRLCITIYQATSWFPIIATLYFKIYIYFYQL